jgi:hypothetical protein
MRALMTMQCSISPALIFPSQSPEKLIWKPVVGASAKAKGPGSRVTVVPLPSSCKVLGEGLFPVIFISKFSSGGHLSRKTKNLFSPSYNIKSNALLSIRDSALLLLTGFDISEC